MRPLNVLYVTLMVLGALSHARAQDPFSVMILSDTQYYSLRDGTDGFPETYLAQTTWIVENSAEDNIKFTIHMGDMTHNNQISGWETASAAHDVLDDADVAYSVCPGNHDYPGNGGVTSPDSERYNDYFGPDRFAGRPYHGGAYEDDNDNNYCFFSGGGQEFMVISLEFAPRKDVLCWANDLISAHPDHNVILAMHCYKSKTGHATNCATAYDVVGSDGEDVWNELARRHSNVFMILSGHIQGVHHDIRFGNNGNKVYEIQTDYQGEQYNGENYGNGWLRKLDFDLSAGTIDVSSFSVLEGITSFNDNDYPSDPSDPEHTFTLTDVAIAPSNLSRQVSNSFNDRRVNQLLANEHVAPQVDVMPNGDFVVVWEDDGLVEGQKQIHARGFHLDGCEKFAEIVVNDNLSGMHIQPHVAVADDGSFVVVWADDSDGNGYTNVRARGFDANGNSQYGSHKVNENSAGQQYRPRVALAANGDQMIVWEDDLEGDGDFNILLAGFSSDGQTKNINDLVLTNSESGTFLEPDIAAMADGRFIVVWQDDENDNSYFQIRASLFAPGAVSFIQENLTVNQEASDQQKRPRVDIDVQGNALIVFEDDRDGNDDYDILASTFDINGQRIMDDFMVNQVGDGQHIRPDVAVSQSRDHLVVWQDDTDNNSYFQVTAALFCTDLERVGDEFDVNENASAQQGSPVVGISQGHWVAIWEDDMDNDDDFESLARGVDIGGADYVETCSILGDIDRDGDVDIADFLSFNSQYGTICPGCVQDLNYDGVVSVDDFLIFNSAFGN